ncbi:MAG: hypothetical protein LUD27_04960 [Clostridia bacterium]|nr:hypothetical protein [Clostridia bacterium]
MIKVSDAILAALQLLDRADIAEAYEGGTLTEEHTRTVYALLHCYNSVEDELARTFFPLEKEEEVTAEDGKFYFTSLAYTPVKILSVLSGGKPVKYRLTPQYIQTNAVNLQIKYRYAPDAKAMDDESDYDGRTVSCRMLAYGVAAEYCLIQGDIAESESFESRYKTAIDGVRKLSPARRYILPRRWI